MTLERNNFIPALSFVKIFYANPVIAISCKAFGY